jgi:YfiH family protein
MISLAMIRMEQVHGNHVVYVGKNYSDKTINNCDGLITNIKGLSLSIRVADCLPIFFYSPTTNSIGVIHAGWRGLYKGIIGKTVELFSKKLKVKSEDLLIYIGPHICQKHYEIKNDVMEAFNGFPKALKIVKGKTFLDLGEIAKEQLIRLGVKKNKIKIDETCTFETQSLDSFRRGDLTKRTEYQFSLPDSS